MFDESLGLTSLGVTNTSDDRVVTMADRTTVLISTVFGRFKDMHVSSTEADFTAHTDVDLCGSTRRRSYVPINNRAHNFGMSHVVSFGGLLPVVNHAYLCLDVGTRNQSPHVEFSPAYMDLDQSPHVEFSPAYMDLGDCDTTVVIVEAYFAASQKFTFNGKYTRLQPDVRYDPGFYPELILKPRNGRGEGRKVKMNAYYKYQLHSGPKESGLLFKSGRLFQLYVVIVLCAIEQSRLDFIRKRQKDLRSDYLSGLTPADRADIVCSVIQQKVKDFVKFLKEVKTFGRVAVVLYTIEFQKRGLPHCHTLLWVSSKNKITNASQIDEYISAELPDLVKDHRDYKVVSELMLHGPCGATNLSAPCTQNGTCNKKFPKRFNANTFFDSNGHTQYRRRDTGTYFMKLESRLDNCNVVPYNRVLCMAFEKHINVEYYGWSMLIKYLFKYISKGPDRILANMSRSIGEPSTSASANNNKIDEIQNYVDGRFICPYEACWRIFDFQIHSRELAVQILNVHLEDKQHVTFRDSERLNTIKGCKSPTEVRTINGGIFPTYKDACKALVLLGDDKECDIALQESDFSATSSKMRTLFAQILIYCDVVDPVKL
nr:DNA helicase [Tanacetum cinerariifolium]